MIGLRDSHAQLPKEHRLAHRREPFTQTHRHVHWMRRAMPLAPPVLHTPTPRQARPPRPIPRPTVLVEFDLNLLHLN